MKYEESNANEALAMEKVKHFSHEHLLSLVQFQTTDHSISNENSDKEDEDKDDIVEADRHVGKCKMCEEEIYSFHLCYYSCKDCDYSLHKLCAQLPTTQQNHPLHPGHNLTMSKGFQLQEPDISLRENDVNTEWKCEICKVWRKKFYNYHCYICKYTMDIICATMSEQKMDHPGELLIKGKIDGQMFSHPHPLILLETLLNESVSLHDPMKKEELLCDGCVRPITTLPFYKCSQHDCGFVLHEWCTRLPSEIQHHHDHPQHKFVLLPKVPRKFFGVFRCELCKLPSNGFAYGCKRCEYYVDVHCAFIADVITHEAHPNHLMLRCKSSADQSRRACKACNYYMGIQLGFHCPTCDFYLHIRCALLLPRTIKHKYDKHPLSLRYYPAENHSSEYFCEICEDEFNPEWWFYHCSTCATSMHTACAPLKLHCEQSTTFKYKNIRVFRYINVKFGGTHEISNHPHPVTFVQGINDDGQCIECDEPLQYKMIFKCFKCKFALHHWCVT
ncbi:hypothetical protein L1987_51133 [Smallanthus sonchifolius]|uniref:Uncharacterized protein n=1 Tax=Smallanthus sonchifolius TaxID=185202 RepID=A0ACB9ENY8_9ASTR|nr:hypothetical protein L1987_51133 [Smallanthus sonchifolius]